MVLGGGIDGPPSKGWQVIVGAVEYVDEWSPENVERVGSIIVRILSGHLDVNMTLQAVDGSQFKVESFHLISAPESYREGIRVIAVRRLRSDGPLTKGAQLDVIAP